MRCNGWGQVAGLFYEPCHGKREKKHLHGAQGRGQRCAHLGQVQHCKHGRAHTCRHEPAGAALLECAGDCLHCKSAKGNLLPHCSAQARGGQHCKQHRGSLRRGPCERCPCSLRTACRQRHGDACECSHKAKQPNQACERVMGRRRMPLVFAQVRALGASVARACAFGALGSSGMRVPDAMRLSRLRVAGAWHAPVCRPSPRPKGQAYKRRDTGKAGVEGVCSHA
mgnify:FL=1